MENTANIKGVKEGARRFIECIPPYKNKGSFSTYACIWFKVSDESNNYETMKMILNSFSEVRYSMDIVSKYENTIAFAQSLLDVDPEEVVKS